MTGRGWLLLVLVVGVAAALAVAIPRLEGTEPEIAEIPEVVIGTAQVRVALDIGDEGSGLRSLRVRVEAPDGERVLLKRRFPGALAWGGGPASQTVQVDVDPAALGLADGRAELVVAVRDWSWRDGLAGNLSETRTGLVVDTKPPSVAVESGLTYVHRGGSAVATYRVDADADRHGVQVGDAFFRGFPLEGNRQVAIFAVPVDAPANPTVEIVARDAAGNESRASVPAHVFDRKFAQEVVSLPASFLTNVVPAMAKASGVRADDPVAAFQTINVEVRRQNEEKIREIVKGTSAERHWKGSFAQLANSAVTSRFAEERTYRVGGQDVSNARHFGFDLASTSAAPITAANAGVVLFAEPLGIYGNCVIVDHGQGLTSLYAHLSRLDVQPGDRVERGQPLGLSGASGLAGGDHLHFAILVGGTYVDPLEWWDAKWVREHVDVRVGSNGKPH